MTPRNRASTEGLLWLIHCTSGGRRLRLRRRPLAYAHLDLPYNRSRPPRRQPGILMHFHPTLKLQQPQLPQTGWSTESKLTDSGGPGDGAVLLASVKTSILRPASSIPSKTLVTMRRPICCTTRCKTSAGVEDCGARKETTLLMSIETMCALSFPRRKPHKGVSAHQFKSFGGIVTVDLCHI